MSAAQSPSISDKVELVERKVEVRRARMRRHWHEVQSDIHRTAQRSARWTPLVGIAAVTLVGFTLARQQGTATSALVGRRAGASAWASLVALAATALQFASSSQGRELWNAWRRARSPS
jgi:hypothetical protein